MWLSPDMENSCDNNRVTENLIRSKCCLSAKFLHNKLSKSKWIQGILVLESTGTIWMGPTYVLHSLGLLWGKSSLRQLLETTNTHLFLRTRFLLSGSCWPKLSSFFMSIWEAVGWTDIMPYGCHFWIYTLHCIFCRPRRSQGLLYKHSNNSFIHSLKSLKRIFLSCVFCARAVMSKQ